MFQDDENGCNEDPSQQVCLWSSSKSRLFSYLWRIGQWWCSCGFQKEKNKPWAEQSCLQTYLKFSCFEHCNTKCSCSKAYIVAKWSYSQSWSGRPLDSQKIKNFSPLRNHITAPNHCTDTNTTHSFSICKYKFKSSPIHNSFNYSYFPSWYSEYWRLWRRSGLPNSSNQYIQ